MLCYDTPDRTTNSYGGVQITWGSFYDRVSIWPSIRVPSTVVQCGHGGLHMDISDYWREQSRKRRIKARETGRCIICMTRDAREGRVTCGRCCAAATASTKRRRETGRDKQGLDPGALPSETQILAKVS